MANLLELYRQHDEKTPQGEVLPENQTLNGERIAKYLDDNGFTSVENFDERFQMENITEVLSLGSTRGEQEMLTIIRSAQDFLEKIGRKDLMIESPDRKAFASTINKELLRRDQLDQEADLLKAYDTFKTVKDVMRNRLVLHEKFAQQRENEKVEIGKGLKETFAGVYEDVKKNFKGMSGKEKAIAVGALILGGVIFLKSDNEHVKKIKEYMWSGIKLAGGLGLGAVGFNYVWKLFTGKTALEEFNGWTSSTAGNEAFFSNTFETDSEKGDILSKSTIYLGDKNFLDLAKRYREAKAKGEKKIQLVTVSEKDITPEEIYTALDIFFSKYPVEKLEMRYRKSKTSPTYLNVVTTMLSEDRKIEYSKDLYGRTLDTIDSWTTRGWNWMVTGAGLESGRWLYLKVRGEEGTDAEVKTWFETNLKPQLDNAVQNDSELPDFCDRKFREHPAYKKCIMSGLTENRYPYVKYYEVPGDAIYVVSTVSMNVTRGNEKLVSHMLENSLEQADKFLKEKFPQVGASIAKFRNIDGGCRVVDNSTFKLFARMPVPGSPEFSRKSVLVKPEKKEAAVDLFKPSDTISYSEMLRKNYWDAERLRIHFMIDGKHTSDLEKICDWFTKEYRLKGVPRKEVYRKMLEDDAERDKCLRELGLKPDLAGRYNLLKAREDQLDEIERDAAKSVDSKFLDAIKPWKWFEDVDSGYDQLVMEMRHNTGYKIRAAILGDSIAMKQIIERNPERYDPSKNRDWMDDLISDYEDICEQFIENYKAGRA